MTERSLHHYPVLDASRGFATVIILVFHAMCAAFHLNGPAFQGAWRSFEFTRTFFFFVPAWFGIFGVPVFFVVSGFCIHLAAQRRSFEGWYIFFVRRGLRIYPPYLVALLAFLLVPGLAMGMSEAGIFTQLWTHLLMVYNFNEATFFSINGSFWSIVVEWQIYLCYPLLLLLVRRFGWRSTLLGVGGLEVALRLTEGLCGLILDRNLPVWIYGSPLYYWFSWTVGARLAETTMRGLASGYARWPVSLWVGLMVGCYFVRVLAPLCFLLAALATVTALAKALEAHKGGPAAPSLAGVWLGRLGLISYSVYLLHQPLMNALPAFLHFLAPGRIFHPVVIFGGCLLLAVPTLALAWAFYRAVELPSIALAKALAHRMRQSPLLTSP